MTRFQEMFDAEFAKSQNDSGSAGSSQDSEAMRTDLMSEIADDVAESMLQDLKQDARSLVRQISRERKTFEDRLRSQWRNPLDLLDLFIALATEAGDEFNREFRPAAATSNDVVFEALTRLHARACQVSSAILVLLRSGYADDALARWRTLYEIAIVGYLIHEHGEDTAERYLRHDTIQRYKLARRFQEQALKLGEVPLAQDELDELKEQRDDLVAKYGKEFACDYGWAAAATGCKRPSLYDLEAQIELKHLRPYCRMASDNVHANAHGTYFRLGANEYTDEVLLAGPSVLGLADPGQLTAISLNQITETLITSRPNLDGEIVSNVLQGLLEEIGDAFIQVHRRVEKMAEADAHGDAPGLPSPNPMSNKSRWSEWPGLGARWLLGAASRLGRRT